MEAKYQSYNLRMCVLEGGGLVQKNAEGSVDTKTLFIFFTGLHPPILTLAQFSVLDCAL